ncbi:threonine--tRNA ligase [Candidatus Nomurabacteria bacterium RIFCSPLOWO2_01_FULL_40_15]|uniref:Threonine--tRNA ligase n=1 Tax=Candidatus Nomurabacteria bacterium RIFCSPLOWO2_01_FULL_40_15 TaxID=1801772 RepID=A0A1F6X6I8_9BACT|nr:MAG: threonine--tRNA ligase [Candidatus Nomurabacteria bacterium RIFCSPLOWO2_01_FULL_40_15]
MANADKLEYLRHSLAHLLAAAVLEIYPDTKNTLGPAIENGFYYDFDFKTPISDTDLPKIEKKMREILKSWKEFKGEEKSEKEAKAFFKNNQYKTELIDEIKKKKEKITFYTCGEFTDLCRGGHLENPSKEITPDAFKLDRVAGAYWRGDEKNKMLTRIYGLAFETKEGLDTYIEQREEAEKRDHKKLGKELDLFVFSELVGSGLPLWTPRGTILRTQLDDFVWELRKKQGYEKVEIPHITKKELYEKSGHWEKFKTELFRITTREGHEFAMKPMNCPHHIQIFDRKQWSYRELPQRYCNTTTCYRDEQTGELSGLSRVRSFTQDDAHVFCRITQVKEEFLKVWDIVEEFYRAFGFSLRVRLSIHDPNQPDKYLGDKKRWNDAELILKEIVTTKKGDWFEGLGEAAFYGPKLDFMAKDALGREWQVATIQLDMNQPERFGLFCINERGEKERIVMLHAAIMGSIDRFLSILIEHTAGAFPLWLSPVQVYIAPIEKGKHLSYAEKIKDLLMKNGIRTEIAYGDNSFGKKIWEFGKQKIPYLVIIGDRQISEDIISFQARKNPSDSPSLDVDMKIEDFINHIKEEIKIKS